MKKRLSEEKGSMAVYVTVVLLSFLILVSGVYALSSANRKVQTKTTIEIKKSYEMYNDKKEKLYDKLSESFQPPDVKKIEFAYTGALQTFIAPAKGVYSFELAGAAGSEGNIYGRTGLTSTGGKGAKIVAKFTLKKGDIVDLVVGGKGTCTQATSTDGTSGGGGGGTFAFKRISSITNSNYQFTKGSINYETLLAVAGGSGSQDVGYRNSNGTGYPGQASSYKSPNNYTAYSTTTNAGTSSASVSGTMGISQFITYDAKGSYYTRNSGRAQGGYGGGGSQDDNYSYGGGWCKGTNTYQSTSWSLDTTATGTDGANSENGYAKITWISF